MRKLITLSLLLLLGPFFSRGQDVHFSQQFDNDLYLNPALSGMGEKQNRLLLQYRDQWRTVPVPYASAFLSYDRRWISDGRRRVGSGMQLLYDRAGDGHLGTVKVSISPSYTHFLAEGRVGVTLGLQAGMIHRFVDKRRLVFESQFDGSGVSGPSGEALSGSATAADLGVGVHVGSAIGATGHKLALGFSTYNLHRPDLSLEMNAEDERPVRYNAYAASEVFLGSGGWSVNPVVHVQVQEELDNILPLLYLKRYVRGQQRPMAFSFGGGYRWEDAAVMYFAWESGDFKLGLSYDLNTSSFRDATSSVGAGELLLKYEWEREREEEITELIDSVYEDTVLVEEEVVEAAEDTVVEAEEEAVVIEEVPDIKETDIPEAPPVPIPTELDLISEGININLYFPNDYPDPRSTDSTTATPYVQIFREYMSQSVDYYRLGGEEGNMVAFVENYVAREWRRYKRLMSEIRGLLRAGRTVTVYIRGYTSPLATGAYNQNLSKRRIQCVINQVKAYEGVDAWFNDGRLLIEELPFGETRADTSVSDDYHDPKRSVYSDKASFERRVEIEKVVVE